MSDVTAVAHPPVSNDSAPEQPAVEVLCRLWRRARDPGLRHGEVFALGALHERVAEGDQHAEGGEVSQHLLLPVRTPLHRRSGAHRAGHREPSILAAIAVADEQRWDGQERSTRYQDFKKSGYYTPDFGGDDRSAVALSRDGRCPVHRIRSASERMFAVPDQITPKPDEMKQDAYERTLRARAFDISRYLLPLATNTSLGEIVNARTLENQVSHLLSHTHQRNPSAGRVAEEGGDSPRPTT